MIQIAAVAFTFLSALLLLQLLYPFLTVTLERLVGRERLRATAPQAQPDFGCIITAYKNAEIARPLVQSLLLQTYGNLVIYLVADECPDVDFGLNGDLRFVHLKPNPPLRLKAKSIRYAMDRFVRPHDYTVVFDADNLAHPRFFEEMLPYVQAGFLCIQGQRTAKNLDTTYAALDSLGEHYKNYLERFVPYRLGGSAVISGSGMATETGVYRAYLDSPEIAEGQHLGKRMLQEDKILQNYLLRSDIHIAYARQAVVYDEKVTTGKAVETQRSRWLFSYFQNIPNALGLLRRGLLSGSFNQLYFAFVTLAFPMFVQVALAGLFFLAGLLLAPWISLAFVVAGLVFAATVVWTLYLDNAPAPVRQAVWKAPAFIWRQVTGLLKMGNPDKNFKPTEHTRMVSVEELIDR